MSLFLVPLIAFCLIFGSANSAAAEYSSVITYEISSDGLYSAKLQISKIEPNESAFVFVALPFQVKSTIWENSSVIGIVNRREYSLALVTFTPKQQEVDVLLQFSRDSSLGTGVRLLQSPYGTRLIQPPLNKKALQEINEIARTTGVPIITELSHSQASFPAGFTLVNQNSTQTLLEPATVKLDHNGNELTKRIVFKVPKEPWEEAILTSLGPLLAAAFALLMFYAGLPQDGTVPTVFLVGTVLIALVLISFRWWFAFTDRGSRAVAISDSIVAVFYLIGLGVAWKIRSKGKGS